MIEEAVREPEQGEREMLACLNPEELRQFDVILDKLLRAVPGWAAKSPRLAALHGETGGEEARTPLPDLSRGT